MKQEHKVALKTVAMKARVANLIRTEIYPYSNNEYQIKYKGKKKLADQDKIRIFDIIYNETIKMSNELTMYKSKRQYKAFIETERNKRKSLVLAK